jgi:hypothetical protein
VAIYDTKPAWAAVAVRGSYDRFASNEVKRRSECFVKGYLARLIYIGIVAGIGTRTERNRCQSAAKLTGILVLRIR